VTEVVTGMIRVPPGPSRLRVPTAAMDPLQIRSGGQRCRRAEPRERDGRLAARALWGLPRVSWVASVWERLSGSAARARRR